MQALVKPPTGQLCKTTRISGAEVQERTGEISFNLDKLEKDDYVRGIIGDRPP